MPDFPWQDSERLRAAYVDQGKSAAEIADELGTSFQTIFKWLRQHGIDTKRGQYPRGEAHAAWSGKRVCPACSGRKKADSDLCDPCSRPGRERENAPSWMGDDVGYAGMHSRLRKLRGPASRFPCADCRAPAEQWAYDHQDSDERWGKDHHDRPERPYSLDVTHYRPLCLTCHRRLDVIASRVSRAQFNDQGESA